MPLLGSVTNKTFAVRGVTATTWPTTPRGVTTAMPLRTPSALPLSSRQL
jgi:hypothetical protein